MLDRICNIVWGGYTLAFILIFGVLLTVRSGFLQIRCLPYILKKTIGSVFRKQDNKSGLSQKGAFCSVLAATMGTGNIIGVASAITVGGPGAVFWMWISAIPGMMIVYAENYFGVLYGTEHKSSGAVCYIEKALKKPVAVIYAVLCVLASLGMGNMVQTNAVSASVHSETGIPVYISGAVTAFLCALVIAGGLKRISSVTEILIPFISAAYILSALYIILKNSYLLPDVLSKIFSGAFGIRAAGGGICGAAVKKAVSTGMKRGVFSNEAGLGTSSFFHSQCGEKNPELQGMWGITEVFTDTVICCTLTALSVLCVSEKITLTGAEVSDIITAVFSECFGKYSCIFVCTSVSLFAFATLIGWSYCGRSAFEYLTGKRYTSVYIILYCICAYTGAVLKLETVWTLSDIFNGLMIIPNLLALIILIHKYKMNTPR